MDTNTPENIEVKSGGDYLDNIISDMPPISPVAETIARKVQDEKQERNPSGSKVPEPGAKKSRGRPRKDGSAPPSPKVSQSRLGGVASPEQRDNAALAAERLAAATFIAGAVEVSGIALGGDEAVMAPLEKTGMVAVWDRYLLSKGMNDIPPGMALCLVMSQYYGRVLTTKKAQPKVMSFALKIKNKLKGIKNARAMRRNDDERENNSGKADGESLPGEGN